MYTKLCELEFSFLSARVHFRTGRVVVVAPVDNREAFRGNIKTAKPSAQSPKSKQPLSDEPHPHSITAMSRGPAVHPWPGYSSTRHPRRPWRCR